MEKYNLKSKNIKFHNIVFAYTSTPDYSMERYILLENMEDLSYNEYIVVEGYHCSCYDFDDTEWEGIKYTKEELVTIARDRIDKIDFYSLKAEKEFYKIVLKYLERCD